MHLVVACQLTGCIVVNQSPPVEATRSTVEQGMPSPSTSSVDQDWRPSNLSESVALCKKVQEAADVPIECTFTYLEELPVMMVAFPDWSSASEHAPTIVDYLAGPFCTSANSASRKAALFFAMRSEHTGNLYSCETNESSGWFDIGTFRD
jgi:hypothetical protein